MTHDYTCLTCHDERTTLCGWCNGSGEGRWGGMCMFCGGKGELPCGECYSGPDPDDWGDDARDAQREE